MNASTVLVPTERIQNLIFLMRGEKVMLDSHLADIGIKIVRITSNQKSWNDTRSKFERIQIQSIKTHLHRQSF